ncbi:uncharacterized protein LOC121426424 [Lytechinus variegatus]|uniref:uncharacterized protein LOC121426424 n=1 Tax=Lytechinus variegatus TaxID=7654 RepID=UPI001BB28007|nr:uncharacterized protein LOC121426424 [Lytechinus variegatus]
MAVHEQKLMSGSQLENTMNTNASVLLGSTAELEVELGEPKLAAERLLIDELDDEDEEIFFGPMTDKEKLKSRKMRRKTEVFKPGFRSKCGKEKEEDKEGEEEDLAEVKSSLEMVHDDVLHLDGSEGSCFVDLPPLMSSQSIFPVELESDIGSPGTKNGEISKEDSASITGPFTHHTPLPSMKNVRNSESDVSVNAPPFSLVTVSPQAEAAVMSEGYCSCSVELFNAAESATRDDSTDTETVGMEQGASKDANLVSFSLLQPEETKLSSCDKSGGVSPKQSSKDDLDEPLEDEGTDKMDSAAASQHQPMPTDQVKSSSLPEMKPTILLKPTPCLPSGQSTIIYSSPLLIPTTVQRVQMQQPVCADNINLIPVHVPTYKVEGMDNLQAGMDVARQTNHCSVDENSVPSSFYHGNSAFGKPAMKGDVLSASQAARGFTQNQDLLATPGSVPQFQQPSDVKNSCQATDSEQGVCTSSANMLHKENVNPVHQSNTLQASSDPSAKFQVLSSISSPGVSALGNKQFLNFPPVDVQQAASPRVLQVSNRPTCPGSPSAASRQRLIDEKRALLARLRAEKQELQQRIKEDNEKCFNMKLENAAALQSNMARGMTPMFDRLPAQGCDGPAALTLTERELEVVTKLHTIRNSQHTASDHTQSPCQQDIHHRDHSRLHWHEDLIINIEELSSPSRPRCKAKTILSKKCHNSNRKGTGLKQSSSVHSGQPRARQHLLF